MITGALGHIGSQLLREIPVGRFDEVLLVDNFSTQRYPSLFDLPGGVRFRVVEADICTLAFDELLDGVETVIHLAAITDAESSVGRPDDVERTNLHGTERVARACARRRCSLVFVSTTSVYGPQTSVVDENCPPEALKPQSPYAASKLEAERRLQQLGQADGLQYITCRFGTVFGPSTGMRFHTAINKFIWQACTGQPLTVWRTAMHQVRPYLDLGDAVNALNFIVNGRHFDNRVYNVVSLNASVAEVIGVLSRFVPDLAIRYVDSPLMNQLSYHVTNQRFRRLGFEFSGTLERGIAATLRLLETLRCSAPAASGGRSS